jgi:uncharacterized repeat protein (TIGR03803 family)
MSGRKPVLALLRRRLWAAAPALPAFAALASVVFTIIGLTGCGDRRQPPFVAQADVVFTTLYSFQGDSSFLCPNAVLVRGSDGSFYGTTSYGGRYGWIGGPPDVVGRGYGTLFKISTRGALTILHFFTGGRDGLWPNGLVQGTDGSFYGTTMSSTTSGNGTVFKISANGR